MVKANKFTYTLAAIIAVLFFIFPSWGGGVATVHAATSGTSVFDNSKVLKDLQKSEDFEIADYPRDPSDYTIYVIQVAESVNGLLYLYTYQPCQDTTPLVATQLNMSLSEAVTDTQLYDLVLVDTDGVFAKYLVKGVEVSDDFIRYYNITSIYRKWNNQIDGESDNNNTINQKSYAVRNIYYVVSDNGELRYYRKPTYTVNIIDPYSDYLIYITQAGDNNRLPNLSLGIPNYDKWAMFDAHYIAFSTDWEIDRLLSADVSYYYKPATATFDRIFGFLGPNASITYGKEYSNQTTLSYDMTVEIEGSVHWAFRKNFYKWNRIQSVAEFISTEEYLTEETKEILNGKQWVLRFFETERTQTQTDWVGGAYTQYRSDYTVVDRVTVLRLEFETDGVVYNLGAVSDTVSGDDKAGNMEYIVSGGNEGMPLWLVVLLIVIVLVIIVLIVYNFPAILTFIINLIAKVGAALIKAIIWLVTLPVKVIKKLSEKKNTGQAEAKSTKTPVKAQKGSSTAASKGGGRKTVKSAKRGSHAKEKK